MPRTPLARCLRPLTCIGLAGLVAAGSLAGCGGSPSRRSPAPPETGLLITGADIRATPPPWPPQYRGLAQRIKRLGLPKAAEHKFHIHALLSIYNHGLYVSVPANIGLDRPHGVESSLHTHDRTGIIHMEAVRRFPFTLGDFFYIWGVRFGAGTLGSFKDSGANRVWVYVNRKLISDPARYLLRNGDSISIGYGPNDSFAHYVPPLLLKKLAAGGLACGTAKGKKQTSCLAGPTSKKK